MDSLTAEKDSPREEPQIRSPKCGWSGKVKVTKGRVCSPEQMDRGQKDREVAGARGRKPKFTATNKAEGELAWRPTARATGTKSRAHETGIFPREHQMGRIPGRGRNQQRLPSMPRLLKPFFRVFINTCELPRWW